MPRLASHGGAPTPYIVLIGRIALSLIFLLTARVHFSAPTVAYAAANGVPMPGLLVPLSSVIAVLGGLSVALGFRARFGAWLLVLFLVPVTLLMHRFWSVADPTMAQVQISMFMKNVGLLGGALLVAHFGAGPLSFDARRR